MPPKVVRRLAQAVANSHSNRSEEQTTNFSVKTQSGTVSLTISIERKSAIDRLLTQAKYHMFAELRDQMNDATRFYNLFHRASNIIDFLNEHPAIKRILLNKIEACINDFFDELDLKPKRTPQAQASVHLTIQSAPPVTVSHEKKTTIAQPAQEIPNIATPQKRMVTTLEKLKEIGISSQQRKMELLQVTQDETQNTLGHVCLNNNSYYKDQYAAILQTLSPDNLLTILKLKNAEGRSIFYLYKFAGLNVCDLIASCMEKPEIICKIFGSFDMDQGLIQALVNKVHLKKSIRNYLSGLSDTGENSVLLDQCLDITTNIGLFCAAKAKRITLFSSSNNTLKTDEQCRTVQVVRDKVNQRPSKPIVSSLIDIEQKLVEIGELREIQEHEMLEERRVLGELRETFGELRETFSQADRPNLIALVEKHNKNTWFYIAIILAVLCLIVKSSLLEQTPEDSHGGPRFS